MAVAGQLPRGRWRRSSIYAKTLKEGNPVHQKLCVSVAATAEVSIQRSGDGFQFQWLGVMVIRLNLFDG